MNLWGFISAAVLLTLMPGPDILFVITQSISRGKKAGIIFACGLCTGLIFHTAAVGLGVTLLLAESPVAFTILKIAGASYLIWLGIKAFWGRNKASFTAEGAFAGGYGKLYRKGILMNLLNPKVLLFFLAFLPQFVTPEAGNTLWQFLLLGTLFMVQALIIFSLVAALAGKLSVKLMSNPRSACWVSIAESIIYCSIGISILFI